jgi:hypothetical protein
MKSKIMKLAFDTIIFRKIYELCMMRSALAKRIIFFIKSFRKTYPIIILLIFGLYQSKEQN